MIVGYRGAVELFTWDFFRNQACGESPSGRDFLCTVNLNIFAIFTREGLLDVTIHGPLKVNRIMYFTKILGNFLGERYGVVQRGRFSIRLRFDIVLTLRDHQFVKKTFQRNMKSKKNHLTQQFAAQL